MYIEQIYTRCLAAASYYIESGGEAAVIDPMREPQLYLELAARRGATIRYVFETHFHADFVSGHLELSLKTGADIVFGPTARAGYQIHSAADGEEFKIGFITLRVLHTPGHTPESSCFLLLDERHNPHSVFTGDTLFVDDVGPPDQAVNSIRDTTLRAGILYDSIESKLLSLPNYVVVYPGHGAGSACGKSIGTERHSTIGLQKQTNYALKAKDREDFIKVVTDGLNPSPAYFTRVAAMNKQVCQNMDEVLNKNTHPVTVAALKLMLSLKTTVVLDTRLPEDFSNGFIPGSVFIGLDGNFAAIAGSVLDPEKNLVIVTDAGREKEAITNLARVGFEKVTGYLEGGFISWTAAGEPTEIIETISAVDFENRFRYNSCTALDVRNPDEWVPGFVAGAKLISLYSLEKNLNEIDKHKPCFIYCATGFRSLVAASILKRNGFEKVVNIQGGMMKIIKTPISIKQLTTQPG